MDEVLGNEITLKTELVSLFQIKYYFNKYR